MNKREYYGAETPSVKPKNEAYAAIKDQHHMYDILCNLWCANTCAPRMRDDWTPENMTLGQCSITSFLVQDIFGGDVYGILRPGGNYHCYNVVDGVTFDLTSEQFGAEAAELVYEGNPLQIREVHFAKEEKRLRYEFLKSQLEKYIHEK